MTELQIDSPLKWPAHVAETDRLRRTINPKFQQAMKEADAVMFLQDEVSATPDITSAKLTCDAMNIVSPMPTQYLSKHPGASVILRINNQQSVIYCDKWQSLAHNIYALHLAIRQFRQINEWGIGSLPTLLYGFSDEAVRSTQSTSASNSDATIPVWQQTLGLSSTSTIDDANAIYRIRAKANANDPDALQTLNLAIAQARKHFGSS